MNVYQNTVKYFYSTTYLLCLWWSSFLKRQYPPSSKTESTFSHFRFFYYNMVNTASSCLNRIFFLRTLLISSSVIKHFLSCTVLEVLLTNTKLDFDTIWSILTHTGSIKLRAQTESINFFFLNSNSLCYVNGKFVLHVSISLYLTAVCLRHEKFVWRFFPWRKN